MTSLLKWGLELKRSGICLDDSMTQVYIEGHVHDIIISDLLQSVRAKELWN